MYPPRESRATSGALVPTVLDTAASIPDPWAIPESPHLVALARMEAAHERMSVYVDAYYWREIADELEAVVDRYVAMQTLHCRWRIVS